MTTVSLKIKEIFMTYSSYERNISDFNVFRVKLETYDCQIRIEYISEKHIDRFFNKVTVYGKDYLEAIGKIERGEVRASQVIDALNPILEEINMSLDDLGASVEDTPLDKINFYLMEDDDDGNYTREQSIDNIRMGRDGYHINGPYNFNSQDLGLSHDAMKLVLSQVMQLLQKNYK